MAESAEDIHDRGSAPRASQNTLLRRVERAHQPMKCLGALIQLPRHGTSKRFQFWPDERVRQFPFQPVVWAILIFVFASVSHQ